MSSRRLISHTYLFVFELSLFFSVPAQAASFPTLDRILSRLSNDDEPEANLSTFSSEMRAMASILDMSTDSSLVLIDELGVSATTSLLSRIDHNYL